MGRLSVAVRYPGLEIAGRPGDDRPRLESPNAVAAAILVAGGGLDNDRVALADGRAGRLEPIDEDRAAVTISESLRIDRMDVLGRIGRNAGLRRTCDSPREQICGAVAGRHRRTRTACDYAGSGDQHQSAHGGPPGGGTHDICRPLPGARKPGTVSK